MPDVEFNQKRQVVALAPGIAFMMPPPQNEAVKLLVLPCTVGPPGITTALLAETLGLTSQPAPA